MAAALRSSGRDIVYSLSNSAPFTGAAEWARLAQVYRTTGDITDRWESMSGIGFGQDRWTPFNGPGHWADPDMLVVGRLGWGQGEDGGVRDSRLTADEQVTHISLWALLSAPMLLGCDLSALDDLTLRLLCNDEVLAVDLDPLGQQARCVRDLRRADRRGATASHEVVYAKPLEDGSLVVGLFNRGPEAATVAVSWGELELSGSVHVRDLWAREDLGGRAGALEATVAAHGARLFRLS
jgi:alpha-galactosidase